MDVRAENCNVFYHIEGGPVAIADVTGKARALFDARRDRVPIAPFTDEDPELGMADGYAVQAELVRLILAEGDSIIGYKAGLTSKPMQRMLGVGQPDFAPDLASKDRERARTWVLAGFTEGLKSPDDTLVFVSPEERAQIREDQAACMGCLSHCGFSSWKDHDDHSTGRLADPRSFCIQKTLQDIAHGAPVDENLMFAGHGAYRFKQDPFYSNNFTPTVKQLVDRILTGD